MRRDIERISMPKGYGLIMVIVLTLACLMVLLWMMRYYG
jgi:hypothetical protein